MLNDSWGLIVAILGLGADADELNPGQIIVRSVVIYGVTLGLIQFGSRRLFGRASLFDAIVAIMLGSIMSRGIIGATPLLQTFAAGSALVGIHWFLATMALRFSFVGPMVKGNPILLIKDGTIQTDEMHRARISMNDLVEALRLEAKHEDLSKIKAAYLERNGKISVILKPNEPRILEASLGDGYQRILIRLE